MNEIQGRRCWLAAACVSMALTALPARADVLDFSYLLSSGVQVSGALDGTLQAGGNLFGVSGIASLALDGVQVQELVTAKSTDVVFSVGSSAPLASLNGSYLDLYMAGATSHNVVAFAVGDVHSQKLGFDGAGATKGFGGNGNFVTYDISDWTASLETVPEPASLALLLLPLAAFCLLRPGRRGVQTA